MHALIRVRSAVGQLLVIISLLPGKKKKVVFVHLELAILNFR